ncbi:MAG: UTP--glucose-1-phosphate uridylyltransferase [Ruminococcus sp.]
MTYPEALQYLTAHGQEHLLRFYDTLQPQQQEKLLGQIADLELERPQFQDRSTLTQKRGRFSPLGALTLEEIRANEETYRKIGMDAIRNAKVGAVLLAGGQGSRLGFEHPKGMFNMGKTRELYIFQCLIQNLMRVTNEAGAYVPLLIMTSEQNDAETRAFLKEHNYFGYSADNVHFFKQETEPAVDEDGKILMNAPDQIVLSPNGNGGWFSSMQRAGLLQTVEEIGIEWLNVFAVDNVLQQIADPVFIGATIASGCASGGKVVSKAAPDERVGVLCLEDDRPSIVEYYEMTEEMRTLRNEDGSLAYRFGVILNYLFRVDALMDTLGSDFPLHIAHKKIPYITQDGEYVKPEEPNGYKFETLVLDMVHMQDSCLAFEVERSKEFAPVKNATGVDSVETAQALLEQNGVVL